MFKVGDSISYADAKGLGDDPLEGIVLEIKEQIKISYHNASGQTIVWVDPSAIELREAFQCSHDAECGWCDESGDCIYE